MRSIQQEPILDVVIVGAGFGGCYLLHLLRKQGFKTLVLEAGNTIGGVWCWNRYPGARVNCEFPFYGFSDPDVWGTFIWTERFPSDSELRAYFQHAANVWDLHGDIKLDTRVVEAAYDESSANWRVMTAGPQAETFQCRWLIAATGTSYKQYIPEWKGRENFKGVIHHSAQWPQKQDVPLEGKGMAVIGAGSSGIQVMQEASKVCANVTQFIRTPNFAVPMRQRAVTEDEIYAYRPQMAHVFSACRNTRSGLPTTSVGLKVFDDDAKQRKARMEEDWKRGGFNWSIGLYRDYLIDPKANRELYDFWCEKTRQRIQDPIKRDLLAPLEPPYYINTKRPSFEQDYFECCDRENVEITNSPIAEFTETSILTGDGRHREFDIVAICTGYDAVTGGLRTMGIEGRNGVNISDKWGDGVLTHLGMFVNGFPNSLMVYGPQGETRDVETQDADKSHEWSTIYRDPMRVHTKSAHAPEGRNVLTIEAKKEAEEAWRSHVLSMAGNTLLVKTNSWYMGANVPGKRREYLVYVGGIPLYKQKMEEALQDWQGFETHSTGNERQSGLKAFTASPFAQGCS